MSFPSIQQTSAIGAFHNAPKPPRKSYNIVERPVAQATHPRAAKPINLRVQTPQISHDELQQRSAKYIFNKNKTYAEGKKLATQWTNRNTYTEAFELYQHLYDLQLTSTQKIELLTTFRTLTEKGAQTVGREFYAWLRCALTRELEGSSPDLTEELKQQIIAGYQEAADLGSYYARYNLAVFYSTKLDDQGQAYTHFVKYTEEHPEKSFGFKELANFMLLHRPDERDNAVAALRKGLLIDEKDPTCAHVAAELALILAETLEKSDGTKEEVSALYEKAQKDPKGDMLTRCKAAFNLGVIQQKGWIATLHGQKKYSHEHVDLPSALELFTESKRYAEDSNAEEHMDSILLAIAETELLDDSLITQEQFNKAFNQIKSAKEQGNPEAAFLFAELMAKGSRFLNKNTKEAIEAFSTVEKTAQRDGDTILQIQSLISLGTCAEPTLGTNCLLEANRLLRDEHFADRQTYLEKLDAALQSHVKALIEENSKLKEQLAAQVKPSAVQQSWIQDIQKQQRAPKEAQDPIRLAVAQLESKQYEEVLKTCTTYLKEGGNSQNWQVWFMLAKASLATNKQEDAIKFLQKCPDADRNRKEMIELQKQVLDKHQSKPANGREAHSPAISQERPAAAMSSWKKFGREQLQSELNKLGLEFKESVENGDYFFDSVAYLLTTLRRDKQYTAQDIRTDIANYLKRNDIPHAKYEALLKKNHVDANTYDKYKENIGKCASAGYDPIWGDELAIQIVSDLYDINLTVHSMHMLEATLLDTLEGGQFEDFPYIASTDHKILVCTKLDDKRVTSKNPQAKTVDIAHIGNSVWGHFLPVIHIGQKQVQLDPPRGSLETNRLDSDLKKREYERARELFHANKNEEALAAFQKLSQLASCAEYHHSINLYMARCYKRLNKLEEAKNYAACAIEKAKNTQQVDLIPYYSLITEINILRKDFQSAGKSIQSLKSYNPNAKEVAQLEKMLVEAKPDPLSLARSQLESKQYEEVKKTCLTYLQSGGDKQKWQVWFMLAKVAFETNNVDDALNFLAQCADVQATPKEIIELKVQMYNNAKELFNKMKTKEALEAFKKLLQSPLFAEKKPSLYYFTARCYKRLGKLDEAAYFAQYAINEARSLNNKADLNMFLLLIADIQICRSEFENARKTLEGLKKNGADANAVSQLEKRLPAQ